MRALITGIALISLSFLTLPVPVPAFTQEICRYHGCGCLPSAKGLSFTYMLSLHFLALCTVANFLFEWWDDEVPL